MPEYEVLNVGASSRLLDVMFLLGLRYRLPKRKWPL